MRTISEMNEQERKNVFNRYFPTHDNRQHNRIAANHYDDYCKSNNYCLAHCYGRYSQAKENAMEYCLNMWELFEGSDLRIISHNLMQFTVGFEFVNPITGVLSFAYITRDYNRCCDIPCEEE